MHLVFLESDFRMAHLNPSIEEYEAVKSSKHDICYSTPIKLE